MSSWTHFLPFQTCTSLRLQLLVGLLHRRRIQLIDVLDEGRGVVMLEVSHLASPWLKLCRGSWG